MNYQQILDSILSIPTSGSFYNEYHGNFDKIADKLAELGVKKEDLPTQFPTMWKIPDRNVDQWISKEGYLVYLTPNSWFGVDIEIDINEEGDGVEGEHVIWQNKISYMVYEPIEFCITYNPITWEIQISQ